MIATLWRTPRPLSSGAGKTRFNKTLDGFDAFCICGLPASFRITVGILNEENELCRVC